MSEKGDGDSWWKDGWIREENFWKEGMLTKTGSMLI